MTILSGFFGTYVLGASTGGVSGVGAILYPIVMVAFAVPLGGTVPLTVIAASI